MMKKACALLLAGALSQWAMADAASVQRQLEAKYPALQIENIQATEMPGIYSGSVGGQIIYTGEDAEHILVGSMIRLKDQKNLTNALMLTQNQLDWKKLPLKDAVKSVRGTGKRQLAVFSDPNCPYCKQLEVELNKLNDVTLYTFVLPLKPQSVAPSKQLFCEKDPALAWSNLVSKGIQPAGKKSCANPVERNLQLAKSLGLNGTPAIVFSNGTKLMGAYPAQEIEKIWKELGL
ncbi:DsbC family protein [Acinetobacter sp.]|uniref:DsbC family protein n=1 Tax=Acinetobacter sp. TaxID=472 RepID=UPI002FC770E8